MKKPFSQKNKSQELDKVSLFSPDFYAFFFCTFFKNAAVAWGYR